MCFPEGSTAEGASCAITNECLPGLQCADLGIWRQRRQICRLAPVSSDCDALPGTTCTAVPTRPIIGATEYGVCPAQ